MSEEARVLTDKAVAIEQGLKRLESSVKRLGLLTAGVGVVISILTAWTGTSTWMEQRRINVGIQTRAAVLPNGSIIVNANMKNESKRQIEVMLLGVRLWRDHWSPQEQFGQQASKLLISDIRVARCDVQICGNGQAEGEIRIANWEGMYLAGGEADDVTFGPYELAAPERARGIWVEALAVPRQGDSGTCVVSAPPDVPGGNPQLCGKSWRTWFDCTDRCKFAHSVAFEPIALRSAGVKEQPTPRATK